MTEKPQKVDPSVSEMDLYKKGEPRGSVPMSTTMRKPEAYSKPSRQKEPKDSNP
jgi:hypothetical protein